MLEGNSRGARKHNHANGRNPRKNAIKDKVREASRLCFLMCLLILLMVGRAVERWIALNIRDVGPMWHLDYTILRRNAGREEAGLVSLVHR